ncbi:hypothetical protein Scep_021567 [Stephania cephalantha]|uniref:SWIM-type domain-containing protein n=1 Tax=Stephania cephalantha TaxID=152367 RepID=A0AAP0FBI0_9MAGN
MSVHMKRQLDANDIAGIRPCKSIQMLQVRSGGPENLGLRKLHSRFHWERQFHDAYTKDIFKKVRKEITDMIYCHLDPNNEIDASSIPGVEKFNIKECSITNWYCKEFLYTVEFRANGQYFDCNCRKFDFCGLLCKHIFEVMKIKKNIIRVHERYILRRWRKDVLRRHSSIVYSGGYPHMTDEYKKFQEIERALHEAVDLCKNNPANMGFLKREINALIEKIRSGDIQVDQAQHMDNNASIQDPNYASIRDPNYVRCRGRPRLNHFRSVRERGNSSQGRPNGLRRGRQSRHGGRRLINSVTIHNSGEGKVLAGRSVVDESMLTEESIPVFKEKGLTVSAKTVNWYESKSYEKLVSSIEDHPNKVVQAMLRSFLGNIYKIQKSSKQGGASGAEILLREYLQETEVRKCIDPA